MPNHAMRLDMISICMWYRSPQIRHLMMQQKHHYHLHFEYKVFDHLIGYKYPTNYDALTYDILCTSSQQIHHHD